MVLWIELYLICQNIGPSNDCAEIVILFIKKEKKEEKKVCLVKFENQRLEDWLHRSDFETETTNFQSGWSIIINIVFEFIGPGFEFIGPGIVADKNIIL